MPRRDSKYIWSRGRSSLNAHHWMARWVKRAGAIAPLSACCKLTTVCAQFVVKVGEYAHVTTVSLWGIHLIIYARCEVANEITHLQTSTVATGLANVMGNKGGAAASFVYRDATSFAFVGCHLAARASRLRERGEDYMNICKGLHLGSKGLQFLHQFHHVFWMGDLNYRINNGDETPEEFARVIQCIESRQLWRLRQQDQLANEMRTKPIFAGFKVRVVLL